MKRELALEFARVTEAAALAAHKWVGRGDKEAADQAAVDAMRTMLNRISIDGEIVIGEGEIDEAPMLYIGEKVGRANQPESELEEGETLDGCSPVDIAVDPVEGTRMTAQGQANAITVLAVGNKGSFLKAPDMYMEKLIVGPEAKGVIDLNKPLIENIHNVAKALNKDLKDMMVVVLDKPRHTQIIKDLQKLGIKVYALPDGERAELIDGRMYMMAPPSRKHQRISTRLVSIIDRYIEEHKEKCEVYAAPFAVYLDERSNTYVEPDICNL